MSNTQICIAIALIRNDEGKILLQKRIDPAIPAADGKWEFPGGHVDFGETPEAAAARECIEETGCTVEIGRFLPTLQTRVWHKQDGSDVQVFTVCYEARLIDGIPKPLDRKVSEVGWFTREETRGLDLLVGVEEFIDLAHAP